MDSSDLQLQDLPVDEALERWLSELEFLKAAPRMTGVELPITESLHRITAAPVGARMNSPHYYSAAVDGLAVQSAATFAAGIGLIVELELGTQGVFVETGSPLPQDFDAVVPVHELDYAAGDQARVRLRRPSNPWRNVRPVGEEVADKEVVLPKDHRIGPLDIGALAAAGVEKIKVYKRPRVAVIPVGSNLVPAGVRPDLGQMIDTNTPTLAGLLHEAGAEPVVCPIVAERLEDASEAIAQAARDCDLVLAVAGPSHGTAFLAKIFSDLGERVLHGVAVKPCHALTLGVVESTPALGLPFHPVAAFSAFDLFVRPVLAEMLGPSASVGSLDQVEAELAVKVKSPEGLEEYLRVKVGLVDERPVAIPDSGGASTLMSLVRASGLVRIPADQQELAAGTRVTVRLLAPERPLGGNILLLGTHDICYDLLRSQLLSSFPELFLHTGATGGTSGLRSLREGRCHMAAIHLFDEETGQYNVPAVQRAMAEIPVVLVNLFSRDLGLVVAPGNPKNIQSLRDLARDDIDFINRQVGSGTRFLLDYHLKQEGVDSEKIRGFDRELRTHMAVAAAVSSGAVDAGPGISTAAKSLRLDFVPCIPERLDLAIPKRFVNRFPVAGLMQVIRSQRFRREAASALPDYDFSQTGQVLWESKGDGP